MHFFYLIPPSAERIPPVIIPWYRSRLEGKKKNERENLEKLILDIATEQAYSSIILATSG